MENTQFTPSESLALIANVINEAKSRFRDNGFSFIFIGTCSFVASLGQFILLKLGYYEVNFYPYFIMPIAAFITFYYYKKKRSTTSKNIINSFFSMLGALLGLNLMVAGFLFWNKFGIALIPFMLILFSIWLILTGVIIKNKIFIWVGIAINAMAFIAFFVGREFHPLVLAIVSFIGIVLPGIFLNYEHKKSHV